MDNSMIENQDQKLSRKYPSEIPNEVIENKTMKIPNLMFLGLAGASMVGSLVIAKKSSKKTDLANFVGQWAPTFLLLGLYNKIVKVEAELLGVKQERSRNLH